MLSTVGKDTEEQPGKQKHRGRDGKGVSIRSLGAPPFPHPTFTNPLLLGFLWRLHLVGLMDH